MKLKALEDKRKPIEPSNWQEIQTKDYEELDKLNKEKV